MCADVVFAIRGGESWFWLAPLFSFSRTRVARAHVVFLGSLRGGTTVKEIAHVQWSVLRHFGRHEFSNPDAMDWDLLVRLDAAREGAGIPFVLTSTFRAGDPGAHGKGMAVDIACVNSNERWRILQECLRLFRRVGVYRRHIHVDVDASRTQGVLWYGRYHEDTYEPSEKEYDDAKTKDVSEEE